MICQSCQKSPASVHVTEIAEPAASKGKPKLKVQEQHLCEVCAQTSDLPHVPVLKKTVADIWKLLQISNQARRKADVTCGRCGLSLEEFRKRGRLGCSECYTAFRPQIGELLERVHGARVHVGRLPGTSAQDLEHQQQMNDLQQRLEVAIRDEAYENAARLRDEIKALEQSHSEEQPNA
jgi:protein arginine kinase activator